MGRALEIIGWMILGAGITLCVKLAFAQQSETSEAKLLKKVLRKLEGLRRDLAEARRVSSRD